MRKLPAMLLLLASSCFAQTTDFFSIPNDHKWPGWETKNLVVPDISWTDSGGWKRLYSQGPFYGIRTHLHQRWKITAGSTRAASLMQFSGSQGKPGQLVKWADNKQHVGLDCQSFVQPDLVSDEAAGLLIADTGDTWVGLFVGDFVGAFGLPVDKNPIDELPDHVRFLEVGIVQNDGTPSDNPVYPDVWILARLALPALAMYQDFQAEIITDGYTAWGIFTIVGHDPVYVSAILNSPADLSGTVGVNDFVPPAHVCLANQPVRLIERKWVTAN